MNEIVNKSLLKGDKCMREMHSKQPGFTYNACGPFPKTVKKKHKSLKKPEIYDIFIKTN